MTNRSLVTSWTSSDVFVDQAGQHFLGSGERGQPAKPFYHYTDAAGLKGILESGAIWGTEYQKLNDTGEVKIGEDAVHAELEAIARDYAENTAAGSICRHVMDIRDGNRIVDMPGVGIYVASFSSDGDLLGQWERYADKGRGYSIGFTSIPLPTGAQSAANLNSALAIDFRPCIYNVNEYRALVRKALVSIAESLEWYLATFPLAEKQGLRLYQEACTSAAANVGASVPFFKHPGFADEREWRLIHIGTPSERFRRKNNQVEYMHAGLRKTELMDLHDIIAGPHESSASPPESARSVLDRCGYGHVNLRASKIPLRFPEG